MRANIEITVDNRQIVKVYWSRYMPNTSQSLEIMTVWEICYPDDVRTETDLPVLMGPLSSIRTDSGESVLMDEDEKMKTKKEAVNYIFLHEIDQLKSW